jgi:hypothetical protein
VRVAVGDCVHAALSDSCATTPLNRACGVHMSARKTFVARTDRVLVTLENGEQGVWLARRVHRKHGRTGAVKGC